MSTISASTTSTTAYKVTADTTGALVLQTGATPTTAVTIDTSQNVGIGTSSPSSYGLLSVVSPTAGSAKISIQDTSGGASPAPLLQFGVNSSNGFNTSDAARVWTTSPSSTTAALNFAAYNGGAPSTAQMTLTGSNLGIGTTSPVYPLHIGTAAAASSTISGIALRQGSGSPTAGNGYRIAWDNTQNVSNDFGSIFYGFGGGSAAAAGYMALFTANSERMRIDGSGYITNTANGNSSGLVQGYQYYRLNSGFVGGNVNTAQSIFGVGVTLVGSTVYEFEMVFTLAKTVGTTSNIINILFAGTATINNIFYMALEGDNTGAAGTRTTSLGLTSAIVTTATTVSNSMSSANQVSNIWIKGTVSINAGGTFIPQYQLSAAPGGAYTTLAGSYIKIAPLSAAGSNTSIGTWA